MLKCPNCGKLNNSKAKFCVKCGYRLNKAIPINKSSNNGKITCPNCGTINKSSNKFCVKCGYSFKHQAIQKNYNVQQNKATQSMNNAYTYSSNYFEWFKNTLIHPMNVHKTNPYFGITSFSLIALFLWIAEVLGLSSPAMMNNIGYLVNNNSPLKVYMKNYAHTETPIGMLILSILSIALYMIAGYIGKNLLSSSSDGFLYTINRFANYINADVIISLALVIISLINQVTFAWIVSDIFQTVLYLGIIILMITVKNKKKSLFSCIYMIVLVLVSCDILQSLITAILGVMMA